MGIIISQYKDPYWPTSIMECQQGFHHCSFCWKLNWLTHLPPGWTVLPLGPPWLWEKPSSQMWRLGWRWFGENLNDINSNNWGQTKTINGPLEWPSTLDIPHPQLGWSVVIPGIAVDSLEICAMTGILEGNLLKIWFTCLKNPKENGFKQRFFQHENIWKL